MKKFLVVLVVLALTAFTSAAFAADIAVSGSIDVRGRNFSNTLALPEGLDATLTGDQRDTQERVRLTIDAKTDGAKGRITIENDWDSFGTSDNNLRVENPMGNNHGGGNAGFADLREAWINFNLPGLPVNVNVGHQLLQLGHGYFFKSMKYGSDAWVVANVTGPNTFAIVDVKASELNTAQADDVDAYVALDVVKLSDALTVGIDLTQVNDRRGVLANTGGPFPLGRYWLGQGIGAGVAPYKDVVVNNLGVNLTGAFGPLNLKAQVDYQMGKAKSTGESHAALIDPLTNPNGTIPDSKFKGNEIVILGDLAAGPAKVNFTAARGTGDKANDTSPDIKQFVPILDADPHYTFLYEYKVPTAALNLASTAAAGDHLHTGFANTTALNLGASMDVAKSLNIGAQLWMLRATQAVAINGARDFAGNDATSKEVGNELDVKVTWKLYDNLTWTWDIGYFIPGKAYDSPLAPAGVADGLNKSADNVTGVQNVLSFKF